MSDFILKKIELYNVFNYYRLNELDFTSEQDGNVILFDVENGGGKTSLFLAIKWGFYGNGQIEYTKDRVKLTNKDFLNTDAKREGDNKFYVNILFEYNGDDYFMSRICDNPKSDKSYMVLKCNGDVLSEVESNKIISTLIPPDYGNFFMFNGETLEDIVNNQKKAASIEGVYSLLGLKQLKDLADYLNVVKTEIRTKLNKAARDGEGMDDSVTRMAELDRQWKNNLQIVKDNRAKIPVLQEKKQEAVDAREKYAGVEENVKAIEDAKRKEVQMATRANIQEEKLEQHYEDFFLAFLDQDIRELKGKCVSEKETLLQVTNYSDEESDAYKLQVAIALDKHISTCPVCASTIGLEEREAIGALLEESRERRERYEANKVQLTNLNRDLQILDQALNKLSFDYQTEIDNYLDIIESYGDAKCDVSKKEKLARESDIEAVKRYSEIIESYNSQISECERLIKESESAASIAEKEYNKVAAERKKKGKASDEERMLGMQKEYVENLMNNLNEIINSASIRKRDQILEKANDVFMTITNKKGTYAGLRYEDETSFSMVIVKQNGEVAVNPSSGEKHVLAISFLVSLTLNTDRHSPMMMDTPLARLDPTHAANIGKLLASLQNQVIFLAQPSELTGNVRTNLMPAVKKEFIAELQADNRARIFEVSQ